MRQRIRRSQLLGAGTAALGTAGFLRFPAAAAEFVYKLGHPDPVSYPPHVCVAQMAAAVKAETNGRMEIQIYPDGQLGSGASMLTQVRLGSMQFFFDNHTIFSTIVPVSSIVSLGFIFTSQDQGLAALDGALGAYMRRELGAKGLYVFEQSSASGFRQLTSWKKPVRTADDFVGLKVRTIPSVIFVDLFKALGAAPTPIDSTEMYTAMQTHLVDAIEDPLGVIESFRLHEVTKYISVTNHIWGGYWLTANGEAWSALPSEIQTVVRRNAAKYLRQERRDIAGVNASVADKLLRRGLVFNTSETASMRSRLGSYYARWKSEFGSTAWGLLEASVGKLS